MTDLTKRSLAKTVSWRMIATVTTTIIAYLFLRDAAVSTAIAITTNIIKGSAYFLHERIWDRADWGRSSG